MEKVRSEPSPTDLTPGSGRLSVKQAGEKTPPSDVFEVPRPAHAIPRLTNSSAAAFRVDSKRDAPTPVTEEEAVQAEYLLPDRNDKPAVTPENSNLNLPSEVEITSTDTGEKIILPAGTYRQILQLPIDSPLMQTTDQVRRDQSPTVEVPKAKSRYAESVTKPIWVRYESLEKIKVGGYERRGGIDLPSHGPKDLGLRIWYAKSETADVASSVFYFVFGGLGYSAANMLGWSAGNIRQVDANFEYRLIRR